MRAALDMIRWRLVLQNVPVWDVMRNKITIVIPEMKIKNNTMISQIDLLESILQKNPCITRVLNNAERLNMPQWYLGAGCIAQTVWNHLSGQDLMSHINDFDLVYFDSSNLGTESEKKYILASEKLFSDMPVQIDVKNQARVHIWYEKQFGYSIEPYQSIEHAIKTWPTTATSVGVKYIKGKFCIYAPYGLDDLFGMVVRPNKIQITEQIYIQKVKRWEKCWPQLKITPWV